MKKGFTLIEIIIVVSLMLVVATIIVTAYSRFNKIAALSKDAEKIATLLNRARTDTVSSKNDQRYGVHFESTKAVLFSGDTYVSNASGNETVAVRPTASISSIVLSGGGSNVLFDRLTGATSQSGTIVITLLGTPAGSKIITISGTGVITSQ